MFFIKYYNYLCMTIKELIDKVKDYPDEATIMIVVDEGMIKEAEHIEEASFTFRGEDGKRYKPIIIG